MTTLIHADVFFLVSTIGFGLLFLLLAILLIYVISIVRKVNKISRKVEDGIDEMGEDAKDFLKDVRSSVIYKMIFGRRRRLK